MRRFSSILTSPVPIEFQNLTCTVLDAIPRRWTTRESHAYMTASTQATKYGVADSRPSCGRQIDIHSVLAHSHHNCTLSFSYRTHASYIDIVYRIYKFRHFRYQGPVTPVLSYVRRCQCPHRHRRTDRFPRSFQFLESEERMFRAEVWIHILRIRLV